MFKIVNPIIVTIFLAAALIIWIRKNDSDVGNEPNSPAGTHSPAKPPSSVTTTVSAALQQNRPQLVVKNSLTPDQYPSIKTPEERTRGIKIGLHSFYGKAIAGLGLYPKDEEKLWDFLVAREEAAMLAHDVVEEMHTEQPSDFPTMAAVIRADVEKEMQVAFGEQTFARIKEMLNAAAYIGMLDKTFDSKFSASGVPLSPKQFLSLSVVMFDAYNTTRNHSTRPTVNNVDPQTSLTPYDVQALDYASQLLNSQQLVVFKDGLIQRNLSALKK